MKRLVNIACVLAIAVLCGSLALGCDNRPRFVPPGGDSLGGAPVDSFSRTARAARERWEADGGADGAAARLTAALLAYDLELKPEFALAPRIRQLLDSLGFGVEVVEDDAVALVNMFPRSDPTATSWPRLVWRDSLRVRTQAVEGGGMRLSDLSLGPPSRPQSDTSAVQAAGLFLRSGPAGPQPIVFVWRRAPRAGVWRLYQTLGPDSLGGTGTASFVPSDGESPALASRTWSRTPGFEECASCAHLFRKYEFHWGIEGFSRASEATEPSPYATFVRLVQALSIPDDELAREQLGDPSLIDVARGLELGARRANWRMAPGAEGAPGDELVFYRGPNEAYRIRFMRSFGVYRVTSIDTTRRAIE
ncbi:MAG: hypothetical protein HOP12_12330 [Candidatus Eisenbacteria bacterium]|uniref:Uncharacterized protein n=1 Tax=Eiseniibacteriota bacterium TaxID=2212470 RepID=A0A849SHT1_UNCEI|nr:hypothetical protein [Candidatus Eisenbacteria bacterium]